MKPGHQAPAPTFDAAALALAAAFTVVSALAFYGARAVRSASQKILPPVAAAPAIPRPDAAPAMPAGPAAQSSPLPFAGDELRAQAPQPQARPAESPKPAADYPPTRAAEEPLEPAGQAQPAQKAAFEPPRLQPLQNISGYLTGDQKGTQAFYAAGAGPAPQTAARGTQAPSVAPLPGPQGASPNAVKRGTAKPRSRANGPQGGTSAISFGTP